MGPDGKMIVRTNKEIFFNSKAIFIEYIDVLKSPYFQIIEMLSMEEENILHPPFDCSVLIGASGEECANWYYNRDYQNIFLEMLDDDTEIEDIDIEDANKFLNKQILEWMIKRSRNLKFADIAHKLVSVYPELVGEIIVWYPYENEYIKRDVDEIFSGAKVHVKFVTGDIVEVLKTVPDDSTYVFSDLNHINDLINADKINYASVLVAGDYFYNIDEDGKMKINIEGLLEKYIFKFDRFVAALEAEADDEDFDEDEAGPDENEEEESEDWIAKLVKVNVNEAGYVDSVYDENMELVEGEPFTIYIDNLLSDEDIASGMSSTNRTYIFIEGVFVEVSVDEDKFVPEDVVNPEIYEPIFADNYSEDEEPLDD